MTKDIKKVLKEGREALGTLVEKASGDSSGETVIRRFLLNLYNPENPPVGFDKLDSTNFELCVKVIWLDRLCGK